MGLKDKDIDCNNNLLNRYDLGGPDPFYLNNFAGVSVPFIAETMNAIRYLEGEFVSDATQDRFYTYIELSRPLYPNDVIKVQGYPDIEYIVKKQKSRGRGKFLYELILPKRNKMLPLHLRPLKKGKKFRVIKNVGINRLSTTHG